MTDIFETLFSAWGNPTPEGRAVKTDASLGSDFSYADPNAPELVVGRGSCLAYITPFSSIMRDQYFADITNDKITRLTGFTEMGEPT